MGASVLQKLKNHKVNCDYVLTMRDGMGTCLAVFDNNGDVAGSISKRPNMLPVLNVLEQKGDEIFSQAKSVVLEVDLDKEIVKKTIELAEKHGTRIYGLVSNMAIAVLRRDFLQKFDCFICNQLEAGQFFADNYDDKSPEEMCEILSELVVRGNIASMVVTMGGQGSVYADTKGNKGICPAKNVQVKDTTGAGDAFCSGVVIGLTYGKTLAEACEIGTRLSASVIISSDNVCPRFLPEELGIHVLCVKE